MPVVKNKLPPFVLSVVKSISSFYRELNGGHIPVRVAGGIKNRVSHLPIELIVKVMSGGADTATKLLVDEA